MNSTNYVNWQNGHTGTTYYSSGQVTTGSFNVNLPAGTTYYFVFDNSFETISFKDVNA